MNVWHRQWVWAWLLGVPAAIFPYSYLQAMGMNFRAKRHEVPANIEGIRTAQLAYDAAFDEFVSIAPSHPRPISALGKGQVDWSSGSAFDTIGWAPDGGVRGSYSVLRSADGRDFLVLGSIDIEADGMVAHYFASREIKATQLTAAHVH